MHEELLRHLSQQKKSTAKEYHSFKLGVWRKEITVITQFPIDMLMVYLLVRYGAQHDAFSDRAKVDGASFPEVSDYHWHMSVWKFRWPMIVYFAVRSYFDLIPFFKYHQELALVGPLMVLIYASAHDKFYFEYRSELAKYADGRKRPEWVNKLAKFLRDLWGVEV